MNSAKVGAHDGIAVVHAPNHGISWAGFWIECACGWTSPRVRTEAEAWQAHQLHVNLTDNGGAS